MGKLWGHEPYLATECAKCRQWASSPYGGWCRIVNGGDEVHILCEEDGRHCEDWLKRYDSDWPGLMSRNRGIR